MSKEIFFPGHSPIYTHLTLTIEGSSVIRAFNKENIFIERFMQYVDSQTAAYTMLVATYTWTSERLDFLVALAISSCILTGFVSGKKYLLK